MPEYPQSFRLEAPVKREMQCWSAQSEATLQDADFRACVDDVNEFADVSLSFISLLADQIVPKVSVKPFSIQKPWVDKLINVAYNASLIYKHLQSVFLCR